MCIRDSSIPRQEHVISHTFRRLGNTFKKLSKDKKMLFFIIGYFCYIDGVYTIISMATTYGGEVGIDSNSMVLALLLTQFVAFPCSILSGTLAKKFGSMRMIKIFILMYMGCLLYTSVNRILNRKASGTAFPWSASSTTCMPGPR